MHFLNGLLVPRYQLNGESPVNRLTGNSPLRLNGGFPVKLVNGFPVKQLYDSIWWHVMGYGGGYCGILLDIVGYDGIWWDMVTCSGIW